MATLLRPFCWIGFHDYTKIERLSPQSDRLYCWRCGADHAIHYGARSIVPYSEVRAFYEAGRRAPAEATEEGDRG